MANYVSNNDQYTIEDFPDGYPRFAALTSTHPSFHISRRFLRLRGRLVLYKQDNLVTLEQELDRIDREEPRVLFLGNCRRDKNEERKNIMKEIDTALESYDQLVKRNSEILCMEAAKPRDITNIRNWVNETGCITKSEMDYLNSPMDLMSVGASTTDGALSQLKDPVEDLVKWLSTRFHGLERLGLRSKVSQDPRIFILLEGWANAISRLIMSCLLGLAIIVPVIVVERINKLVPRIVASFFGTTAFIALLSFVTKAKTVEMFIAGAT
ncbi:hypothetical protein BM1_08698 [Bipolaris maydis]|nr:hypothetical protein BM1_08698 [Bipolaris maydis]